MLRIIDVDYLEKYQLKLYFNNGENLKIDLKEYLDAPAYKELKEPEKFKQFGLVRGTLEWFNNSDFAPEFLYKIAVNQNKVKM